MTKTVLITGAAGNLGKAAVEKFSGEGHRVVVTVSPGKTLGYDVQGDVAVFQVDLTNEEKVESLAQKIITTYQRIDTALLLVGGFAMGNIAKTDGAALRKMYSLNFETAYFMARPVFMQMLKQENGGRIVLVGSRPALKAGDGKNVLAYGLSKSLLFKLADFLNAEGADRNVVTSVIVPSIIDTPENRQAMPQADPSEWVQPEEIAGVLAFISSAEAKLLREPVLKVYGRS